MADAVVQDTSAAEDAEWADALEEYAPGYDKEEVTDAEPDTTTETTTAETTTETTTEVETTTDTTTVDPNETAEQKVQREQSEADAAKSAAEQPQEAPDTSLRVARQTSREAAKEVEEAAKDVREKMFADTPTHLQDKDGDPITSIKDVMNLLNPVTGEAFTEAEAAQWLTSAQREFNERLAETDKQVTQIAEVQVDLKDQADSINYQYGELLKSMPELRDQLWGEFEKTLVRDPASGIITSMPVSLENFYEMTLQPYVKLAESLEAQTVAQTAAEKAQAEAKIVRTRADRSDIYGRGKIDDMSDDEKEWSEAAKDYYGNK